MTCSFDGDIIVGVNDEDHSRILKLDGAELNVIYEKEVFTTNKEKIVWFNYDLKNNKMILCSNLNLILFDNYFVDDYDLNEID